MSAKSAVFFGLVSFFFIYTVFVYTTATETIHGMNPIAADGKLLWQKHNCTACHQLYGLGGYLGPELTTVISKKGEAYGKILIKYGTQGMPDFHLSDEEVNSLIEFLKYVDTTAESYKYNTELEN